MDYHRPSSVAEACRLKAVLGQAAGFWAGGTDLGIQRQNGQKTLRHCLDLGRLDVLRHIRRQGETVVIGSLVTIAELATSEALRAVAPALVEAAHRLGTPQIRNVATLGGNLCNAAPSADLAPPLLVLDATVTLAGPAGQRILPLNLLFRGPGQTTAEEGELLTEVTFAVPPPGAGMAFEKLSRTSVDIALVNAAVHLWVDSRQTCTWARVALGAVAPVPLRAVEAEGRLTGSRLDARTIDEAAELAARETKPITDVRASGSYRRAMSRVLTRRALERALARTKEGQA